jgi:DNA-binding NarL/FixJ family response regulator
VSQAAEDREFYSAVRAPGQLRLVGASGRYREGLFCLSPCEQDVMRRVADGLSTAEIAEERGTSYYTVQRQRKVAMAKLGATNECHAVALLFREGYLE